MNCCSLVIGTRGAINVISQLCHGMKANKASSVIKKCSNLVILGSFITLYGMPDTLDNMVEEQLFPSHRLRFMTSSARFRIPSFYDQRRDRLHWVRCDQCCFRMDSVALFCSLLKCICTIKMSALSISSAKEGTKWDLWNCMEGHLNYGVTHASGTFDSQACATAGLI